MKSENKNFLYNIVYQLLTFIIPLIITPYISRILGVDKIGIYSYTYSIVYMFMLLGMLGINNYGTRAIASVRDDKNQLNKTFWSIYSLQLIVNIIAICMYAIYILFICEEYKTIAIIQGLFILSICFDVNWFFFGIEKFKLTIMRNLIIKLSSILLIFAFVNDSDDLAIYCLIMSGATLLSQLFLILLLPRYISYVKINILDIKSHIKGVIVLFVPVLAFGIYKIMDKTMIGSFSTMKELGYYESAEKLLNIPSAIISALGTVMLPRMSYLFSKNDSTYKDTLLRSITLIMKLSTMMFVGVLLISNEVVVVLFGDKFLNSIKLLQILSVTIIASSWANLIRTQYLIPLNKNNIYVASTVWAAIINFLLNIVLIPIYGAVGACIGTIVAEYIVVVIQVAFTWKELPYIKYIKVFLVNLLEAFLIVIIPFAIAFLIDNIVVSLIVKIIVASIIFVIINYNYLKTEFFGIRKK